jgi:hypothetical protein
LRLTSATTAKALFSPTPFQATLVSDAPKLHETEPKDPTRMLAEPTPEPKSPLKNPLVYSSAILAIVGVAIAFIMYSRWQDTRTRTREVAEERAEKQREQDRTAVEQLGGKDFAILDFYASPRTIHRGESAQLCYGVSNAKTVTLEPQPHPVWPAADNCVDVSPKKTTTYTLTIGDGAGHAKSQTLDLPVR